MQENEFRRRVTMGGYATAMITRQYMEQHQAPYTEADVERVYRMQERQDARELRGIVLAYNGGKIMRG